MNKIINGKMLFEKNSKRDTKFIISYWIVETEDDGEEISILHSCSLQIFSCACVSV